MRRFEQPLPSIQPLVQPAVLPIDCPFCGIQACVLVAVKFVQPDPLPVDAEPTPEQLASHEQGVQVIMGMQCQNKHQWQAALVQRPNQGALMLLTDMAGHLLDKGALAQSRQRYQQAARLVVARQ